MVSLVPSIRAVDLTKRFGPNRAIDRISFEVGAGEVVGFLGPNGAGKSTTMRILTGLLSASSGEAWVAGRSVAREPAAIRHLIGFMPENNPLPEDMRVTEYLRFRSRIKGLSRKIRKTRIDEVLELCDLKHGTERKLIGNLSKGYRQRVGIADAILAEPPIVILDEPTIGLDPHQILGFRQMIQQLRGRMTLVISSHILPEIEKVCDRSVILNRGQVVAAGTRSELREVFSPGQTYELRVEGSLSEVEKRIKTVDHSLVLQDSYREPEGNVRRITFSSNCNTNLVPRIIESLQGPDLPVIQEIRIRRASLEDIFLAATKRTWKEGGDPSAAPRDMEEELSE
ncbi:ABC transporter ATP-binding protein [Puniceicoccus vermicola]|uniref:ABC transporter ATP-binding protein n=1 Tax=Puniceicoccus vermicola TaxID=388746 RepID=A0A7X1B277_9BACT|nr:ABC transporter ATP-binding protein [Puniceicoccus vermicola]MBC2603060.1 ABC transporter ATP-binding protein [Puniceicoccus vermicola]